MTGRAGRESHTRSTRLTDTGTRTCPVHSVASEYFLYTSGHEWMEGSIEEERRGLNPLRTLYLLLFTSIRLELTVRGERWVKSNPGPRFQFLYIVYKYVFIITHTHILSLLVYTLLIHSSIVGTPLVPDRQRVHIQFILN